MQLSKYLIESIQKNRQQRCRLIKETSRSIPGGINPILKIILEGVYDDSSPLSTLRGTPHIVQMIYTYLIEYWKLLILCHDEDKESEENILKISRDQLQPGEVKDFSANNFVLETTRIAFPPPQDLNIHMMPFVLENSFEKCYLPDNLRPHWENLIRPLFRSRHGDCRNEEGRVCYLNIYEGTSKSIVTHNLSGLHINSQGKAIQRHDEDKCKCCYTEIKTNGNPIMRVSKNLWDKNLITRYNKVEGGIYVATSVSNSCAAWNSKILVDSANDSTNIIGTDGDIEHLRNHIGKRKILKPDSVYWITDRTPFEFLPLPDRTYIQYFSVVTSQIYSWLEDSSTPNPLGIVPNSNDIKIIKRNKL